MTAFVERAALHQTRFRTPGVTPDTRGVVMGQKGTLLFPSLDRVVAFFRAYGEAGSLDEILPGLSIRRVTTPLRTRELLVTLTADSSYRMDRVAQVARLAGGMVFTGTSRHFVRYRDASAPLGYDVSELLEDPADAVLYDTTFRQVYKHEREISFRELVLKLDAQRIPSAEELPSTRLLVTAETGIGHALVGYLFRWRVRAGVALCEWPSESAFDDHPRRAHLFMMEDAPARVIALLRGLPGVHVFVPLGDRFAVEAGFRHPIALESCQSLFAGTELTLFRGDGQVTIVNPMPVLAPVGSLVRSTLSLSEAPALRAGGRGDLDRAVTLDLRLAATSDTFRNVKATVVPAHEREWLARMLYVLPQRTLEALRVASTADAVYLIDADGIEGVPIGRFYCEVAPRIFVPAGTTLVPAVAPSVLEDLVRERGSGYAFFEPSADDVSVPVPRVLAAESFGPISRRILREVGVQLVHAEAPDRVDPPLPLMQYGPARRFPLWGVPGQDAAAPGPSGSEGTEG